MELIFWWGRQISKYALVQIYVCNDECSAGKKARKEDSMESGGAWGQNWWLLESVTFWRSALMGEG